MPDPPSEAKRHLAGRARAGMLTTGRRKILLNASYGPSLLGFRGPLIDELARRGHQVHVSAPDLDCETSAGLLALGAVAHPVAMQRTGTNPLADLAYFLKLRALMRRLGPDLALSYTIKPNIWAALAARSLGIRSASLVTGLGRLFEHRGGLRSRLARAAIRSLYRAATDANDVVIFQNPDDLEDFVSDGWLADRGKARLVNGSGVDMAHFVPVPVPDAPVFLMMSRLLVSKGVRLYAQAALHLLGRGADARFLLAGFADGGPGAIAAHELERWQAAGLEYLGPLEDVRPALAQASVFVLPSSREGTPRSALEALAMGRAVITTDVPGCRQTVDHGVNGLLVPPGNQPALAKAMELLIGDAGLRSAMGKRGLEFCRERFDVRLVNRDMLRHLGLA